MLCFKIANVVSLNSLIRLIAASISSKLLYDNSLPFILETNPDIEAYWVPRVNTVAGITDEHITKWGWRIDEQGWVNFPDWQMRIYRNLETIYWIKPVHEQLKGYTKFANLPAEEKYALYHPKDIGRQEKQNAFYETI